MLEYNAYGKFMSVKKTLENGNQSAYIHRHRRRIFSNSVLRKPLGICLN